MINQYSHKEDYLNNKKIYKKTILNEIEKGSFINGKCIEELEKKLNSYLNIKHSLCVSSGTNALLIALMAINIKENDEIITTPLTWIATSEVIVLLKAKPIFVDIDIDSYNIDVMKIEKVITKNTKAILPVSIFGNMCNMDKIMEIAKKHNLYVIEDGAQSIGAIYNKKKSCSVADISCTSFYPTKPLGGWGNGGACFTNNDELAYKIKCIRNNGCIERHNHLYIGLNCLMDSLQGSILNIKIDNLEESLYRRIKIAEKYDKELKNIKNIVLPKNICDRHVYAQYVILLENKDIRNKFIEYMKLKNINLSIFYPKPIYMQKCMKKYYKKCENTENICDRIISLICYDGLKKKELNYIINSIKKFFNK